MFNIGGGELIVIMLIALIVLGPQRLPDAARRVGSALGELRRLSTSFQNEVRTALDDVDDPTRIADRRNPLATSTDATADTGGAVDVVEVDVVADEVEHLPIEESDAAERSEIATDDEGEQVTGDPPADVDG